MKNLKWKKMISLSAMCACIGVVAGGCGNEIDITDGPENYIGLEMTTEIDDLEVYDNMKYEEEPETYIEMTEKTENSVDLGTSVNEIYEEFLEGNRFVYDEETGEEEDIYTLAEAENGTYLYRDINGDMVEELHVKSDRYYYVLQAEGDKLEVLYSGTTYEYPVNEGDLIGVLYYRMGDAPKHETYEFHTFGLLGETGESAGFEWYDSNENEEMDVEDLYLFDDNETDMGDWLELTRVYRDLDVENEVWGTW